MTPPASRSRAPGPVKRFLSKAAPRQSRRRLLLTLARDFAHSPSSLFRRLSTENFANHRVARALRVHCCICGADGALHYDFPDVGLRRQHGIGLLRETLTCRACGGSMRDRQMAVGLLQVVALATGRKADDLRSLRSGWNASLRILDTDSFSAINGVLRGMPGYVHSQFKPELDNGATLADGSLNVNLVQMPLADASFDVIMTSDVMEHVESDGLAHREILRCLAPGGTYVFTIPFDPTMVATRRLTVPAGRGNARFFLERHSHGDPHSSGGILAHRIYGQQLLADLDAMGYQTRFQDIDQPEIGVFGGDLFLAVRRP